MKNILIMLVIQFVNWAIHLHVIVNKRIETIIKIKEKKEKKVDWYFKVGKVKKREEQITKKIAWKIIKIQ